MSDPVLLLFFFLCVVRGRFFDKVILEQSFEKSKNFPSRGNKGSLPSKIFSGLPNKLQLLILIKPQPTFQASSLRQHVPIKSDIFCFLQSSLLDLIFHSFFPEGNSNSISPRLKLTGNSSINVFPCKYYIQMCYFPLNARCFCISYWTTLWLHHKCLTHLSGLKILWRLLHNLIHLWVSHNA